MLVTNGREQLEEDASTGKVVIQQDVLRCRGCAGGRTEEPDATSALGLTIWPEGKGTSGNCEKVCIW